MRIAYRYISLLCTLALLLSVSVACRNTGIEKPNVDTNKADIVTITDNVNITSELTQCYIQDDLLRIECIQPGLDSYSLSVILYSLTQHKVLSTIDLGENTWQTGWTAEGFYAASTTSHIVQIFDRNGQLTNTCSIPNNLGNIFLFAMNEAADTMFLGVGDSSALYLYDIPTATAKQVGKMPYGYSEILAYRSGYFYFCGEDDLLRIHEDAEHAETVYCNSQPQRKFVDMGIRTEEESFILSMSADNRQIIVPMQDSAEYPITADDNRFATFSASKNVLRLYDITDTTISTFSYSDVHQVVLTADYMLVNTRNDTAHSLYWIPITTPGQDEQSFTTGIPTTTTNVDVNVTTGAPVDITQLNAHLINVPTLSQFPDYPTGCESVSTVMLLQYWDEDVSVDTFIDDYLPKSSYFHSENGIYYGPNPWEYFIGDPRSEHSYGCMSSVILRAVNNYYGNINPMADVSGLTLPELCREFIANDQPVLVWVTIGMVETFTSAHWKLEDGTLYAWPANEHCMLLVGYDEKYYYFNDPYTGKVKKYSHRICENRYTALGSQALVIVQ